MNLAEKFVCWARSFSADGFMDRIWEENKPLAWVIIIIAVVAILIVFGVWAWRVLPADSSLSSAR